MIRFLYIVTLGALALAPALVQAQWQIQYSVNTRWYQDYVVSPTGVPPTEVMVQGSKGGAPASPYDFEQVGSASYKPLKFPNLYQEVGSGTTVTCDAKWLGDPTEVPTSVNFRITTSAEGWYNYAIAGSGTISLNNGFNGGATTITKTINPDGTENGYASFNYVLDQQVTNPNKNVDLLMTVTLQPEITHARLVYEYPSDYPGDRGINVGVTWSVQLQAIS